MNELSKKNFQNEINFHIGMKKVQTGTDDYKDALKKFLEKDELHQIKCALNDENQGLALRKIHALKIKSLNFGLMNLYELFMEMEQIVSFSDLSASEELIEEANESKQMILAAIA